MTRNIPFEQEIALKRYTRTPSEEKPQFNWREVLNSEDAQTNPQVKIQLNGTEQNLSLTHIADTVGNALSDLLLSRQTKDIFTPENQRFVALVAKQVSERISKQIKEGSTIKISDSDLHLLIEKALIENDAHDVAKSLVLRRSLLSGDKSLDDNQAINVRLIRRNKQVVRWNQNKIEIAVRKSFLSLEQDSEPAIGIARAVTQRVQQLGQSFINIEDVQDMVQEEIMKSGFYKVAEAYILYRAQHAHLREELEAEEEERTEEQSSMVVVKKDNGETYFWDGIDLKKRIEFAMIGLDLSMTADEIENELRRSIYAEISETDIKKTVILNAKALIEKDADFSKFAGRILLSYVYEEVLDWSIEKDGIGKLKAAHKKGFKRYLKHAVKINRLNPELLEYNIDTISSALDPSADLDFDYLGIQTLYDRYLIVDKTEKKPRRLETPQFFWMRVAMGLFIKEKKNREEYATELYTMYKTRRFCSSTPTLFNSGTNHSQLSSCYLYKVDDNIESIMYRGISENAFLSKWAGGLGGSWTAVRGTGSYIKGTNGESQGVIPFLKLHNDQLVAVNQGGKRRGSGCAYLETWHSDIIDFLELRRNTGDDRRRTHDMNTANWIPDLFMKRMEAREDWTLFQSNQVPELHETYGKTFEKHYAHYEKLAEEGKIYGKKIPAIELWRKMLTMLFETGHPWITFKDPCNVRSPQDHVGVIHSSNLCTEITLNTNDKETAVCNLGSIILDNHLDEKGNLDHKRLKDTIKIAIRALDNVIDINFYPTEAARYSNQRHRPIGLGVMGLQNALYKKDISFDSEDAVEFNDEFMEAIAFHAIEASSDLAKERGTYSSYADSKWDRGLLPQDTIDLLEKERGEPIDVSRPGKLDWKPLREKIKAQGMRNSNVMAIAPTATISNIMGTTPCIEPTYKNLFVKSNLSGDFIVLNAYLVRDLKKLGLWTQELIDQLKYFDGELDDIPQIPDDLKKKYSTAFKISYNAFLDAAARRQKWIDQAQSVNLFLGTADLKTLSHTYRAAWRKGLKTTYYLRTLGASNIEKATISVKKEVRGTVLNQKDEESSESKKTYTAEEKAACSLEAMMNGEECEACQ